MTRNYWPVGFGLAALGVLLPWFDPVTTPRFNALNFPFAHSAYLWPSHFVFFSYGTAAIVVGGLGFIAWRRQKGLAVFWAGALLLLSGLTFFLQVTSWEPTWLKAALEGGEDFQHCYHLEVAYSTPNAVIHSPARGLFLPVVALADRFSSGVASLGSGWTIFMIGAIWICAAGLHQAKDRTKLKLVLPAYAVLAALIGALQLWRPVIAERYLASSQIAETRGAFTDAEKRVRRAMAIDEWQRLQPACLVQLGALYEKMGSPEHPETFFSRAVSLESRGLIPEALFEYGRAADEGNPDVRRVALVEKAKLAARYAGSLFKEGVIGEACRYWLMSIHSDPDKINGLLGAGRAFRDMADYPSAITHFESVLKKTAQPNLLADTESELGDCWYKMGHPDVARTYYVASRKTKWEDRANFRALKTLTDSYYK